LKILVESLLDFLGTVWQPLVYMVYVVWRNMSYVLEIFSTEVSTAYLKVIVRLSK
jgi:hypothetical protein